MELHARRRRLIPAAVLTVGLLCTFAASLQVERSHQRAEHDRLARSAGGIQAEINERVAACQAMLRAAAGLFAASEYVTAAEFRRFVAQLQLPSAYPGIDAIGVSLRAERPEILRDRIDRELGSDYTLAPTGERSEYFAVIYLEPLDDQNRSAIGHDMFTDPDRRAAMERARDTGEPAASPPVTLRIHSGVPSPGFQVYFPLYEAGELPDNATERRRRLVGFVHAPILAHDFLGALFPDTPPPAEFAVFDAGPGPQATLIYETPGYRTAHAHAARIDLLFNSTLQIAGREWRLEAAPGPAFRDAAATPLLPFVAGGGALLSLLLFGLARVQLRAAERSERTASELRENEALKSAILESALDAIVTTDDRGRILEWNPAADRIFALPRADAIGKPLADFIVTPVPSGPHRAGIEHSLLSGDSAMLGKRTESAAMRADGTQFPVELSVCRVGTSDPARFTCFIRDITDRVRTERHRAFMTRELDHRVKNNLAAVIAILGESGRRSQTVDQLVRNASGRIRALASLHEMLAARNWQGAETSELVARTLAPYVAEGRRRVEIRGEEVTLPGRAASSLCMALHELATNAAKYGSLSAPGGAVAVSWRTDDRRHLGRWLVLEWEERGGPPVTRPAQRGFGSELIEDGVAFEAGGVSHIQYDPAGLKCRIEIPCTQTDAAPDDV